MSTYQLHGVYNVPDFLQNKVPVLVTSVSHSLVFGRESLENDVLVPPIVHHLPHFLEEVTVFIQHERFIRSG